MTAKTAALALSLAIVVASARAEDWPQFRGPGRDGRSAETGLLKSWPEGGPRLLWSVAGVGQGYTQAAVAKGLIYTTGLVGKEGLLRAYDPNGNLKWQRSYGPEWDKQHPGARSIPTVHDGRVYVASGVGRVSCFEAAGGGPVWSLDVFERYQAPQVKWGFAESLLIDGNRLICTPCGKLATMVALDRRTGAPLWSSKALGQTSSFCSPILIELPAPDANGPAAADANLPPVRRLIVTILDSAVVAFAPDDGEVLWQHPYRNFRGNHPVTPVHHQGMLYITSGYGKGAIGLALSPDGRSVRQVWEQPKQDTIHGNVVLLDGYVYGSAHQNSTGWLCVELKTGRLAWEDKCVGRGGSVCYADGLLYCYAEDGTVGLVRPSSERCQVISTFKVTQGDGPHWAHPTISGGRLYIRHGDVLMCYDIAEPSR